MPTILLVDDEPLVREELGGFLEDEGFSVIIAGDGDEGLELYKSSHPDMVITDAKMPKREGLALAQAILEENAAVPITMITGHGSETMAIEALRLGITDFIKKPVKVSDLLAALERMKGACCNNERDHLEHMTPLPRSAQLVRYSHFYSISNRVEEIPNFVGAVLQDFAPDLERRRRDGLHLAFREIMINAVEHGNLAISYEEKSTATEEGTLDALIAERTRNEMYRHRRVSVEVSRTDDEIEIIIEDEGDGFDWRSLPDPTDPSNLLRAHGRGVLLAHLSVDGLSFNEAGNKTTLTVEREAR